jgi:hypothetical protein
LFRLQGESNRSVACAFPSARKIECRDDVTDRLVAALRAGRTGGSFNPSALAPRGFQDDIRFVDVRFARPPTRRRLVLSSIPPCVPRIEAKSAPGTMP